MVAMRDTYEATWRSKRMSARQLFVSHATWAPIIKRDAERLEARRREAEEMRVYRELERLVALMEPVPDWCGPCIVSPKGEVFPVMGSHEGTASAYFKKHLSDEYQRALNTRGYIDALQTLCDRGWRRVSWYGEITDAYRSSNPELSDQQIDVLTAMANEYQTRKKMSGNWAGFSEHLTRAVAACQGLVPAGDW